MGEWVSCSVAHGFRTAMVAAGCCGLFFAVPAMAGSDAAAGSWSGTAVGAPVGVNACYSRDNGDPRLMDFRYGPATVSIVDKRAKIHFRVRARDTGGPGPAGGLRKVRVWFGTSGFGDDIGTPGHDLTRRAGGWWTGAVFVPRRSQHRMLPVVGLDLRDRAGNTRSYSHSALQKLTGRSMNVSITTAKDKTPARLTAFSVTPKSVDARDAIRYVTFTARMVDPQSTIGEVVVDGKGDTSWLSPEAGSIVLRKVAATLHLFRARVPVTRWVGDHRWRTAGVWTWNSAGRLASYPRQRLAALGFDGDFSARSGTDATRAKARSFQVSDTALDVRHGDARVSVRVHATDVGAGVADVYVFTESDHFSVILRRTSGTGNDGIWTGTTTVSHCRTPTSKWPLEIAIVDGTGYDNETLYDTKALAAQGWQHQIRVTGSDIDPPQAVLPSQIAAAGPIPMTFNERVQGIDRSSVRIRWIRADGSRGRALMGRWRCFDGPGIRTDCRSGSVRFGRFRPAQQLAAGGKYEVALNPNHHLGVTDLAGNPLRQTVRQVRISGGTRGSR
jgi:hypothetical protein